MTKRVHSNHDSANLSSPELHNQENYIRSSKTGFFGRTCVKLEDQTSNWINVSAMGVYPGHLILKIEAILKLQQLMKVCKAAVNFLPDKKILALNTLEAYASDKFNVV